MDFGLAEYAEGEAEITLKTYKVISHQENKFFIKQTPERRILKFDIPIY